MISGIIKAEKIHVSNIVSTINRKDHDYAIYGKHKRTLDEIEAEIHLWRVVTASDGQPLAFVRVHLVNWLSRTVKYSIVFSSDSDKVKILYRVLLDLFETYNCSKLTTDIIYDRSDTIKDHIFLGSNIEVRNRQHLYLNGKYAHVVEMAIFQNELKNE